MEEDAELRITSKDPAIAEEITLVQNFFQFGKCLSIVAGQ